MEKEIILLILHIMCVLCFGIRAIIAGSENIKISSMICTLIWAVCVGLDIAKIIFICMWKALGITGITNFITQWLCPIKWTKVALMSIIFNIRSRYIKRRIAKILVYIFLVLIVTAIYTFFWFKNSDGTMYVLAIIGCIYISFLIEKFTEWLFKRE